LNFREFFKNSIFQDFTNNAALFDIDDWIVYSTLMEFIYFNVVDTNQFKMIKFFSTTCLILIRKKTSDIDLKNAEFYYRSFLMLLFKFYDENQWKKKPTFHKALHFFEFFKKNGPGRLTWCKHFEVFHLFFKRKLRLSNYINCSEVLCNRYLGMVTLKLLFPHFFEKKSIYFSEDISFKSSFKEETDCFINDKLFDYNGLNIYIIEELKILHKIIKIKSNVAFYDKISLKLKYGEIQGIYLIKDQIILLINEYNVINNNETNFCNYTETNELNVVNCLCIIGEIFCFNSKINILWIE